MTLLERIEKKIFFKIVRVVTLFFALLAFVAIIAGVYTSISSSSSEEINPVQIQKNEIDEVLKPEPKSNATADNESTQTDSKLEDSEEKKLAESFVKKLLAANDVTSKDPNYNSLVGQRIDELFGLLSNYDDETKLSALKQLDELSNSFKKDKFIDETNVFLELFKRKYTHEQELLNTKNAAVEANRLMAVSMLGAGIVAFALFVIVLVLLRIEKNTRPVSNEQDEYDAKDKKLLIGMISIGVLLAIVAGWGYQHSMLGEDNFDPVSELKESFQSSTQPAEAAAPAAPAAEDAAAPAADYAAPAAEYDDVPAAEAAAPAY